MVSKVFVFMLFVSLAYLSNGQETSPIDELKKEAAEIAQSLKEAGGQEASNLQKLLSELLERIRVRVQERHQSAQDLIEKFKEVAARVSELNARKGEAVQALVERLQGRVKELVQSIVDKLTGRARNARSIAGSLETFSDEELLKQLDWDRLMLETFIRTQVDEAHESLNRQRRQAENTRENALQQIKEMFNKIVSHLLGRYREFTQWLQSVWKNGIEQAKGHHERLVAIAKEVIADAKDMQKETLRESLEVLRPYRQELGSLWNDLTTAVNQALRK